MFTQHQNTRHTNFLDKQHLGFLNKQHLIKLPVNRKTQISQRSWSFGIINHNSNVTQPKWKSNVTCALTVSGSAPFAGVEQGLLTSVLIHGSWRIIPITIVCQSGYSKSDPTVRWHSDCCLHCTYQSYQTIRIGFRLETTFEWIITHE